MYRCRHMLKCRAADRGQQRPRRLTRRDIMNRCVPNVSNYSCLLLPSWLHARDMACISTRAITLDHVATL